jgi:uncharacterized membrane protein
MNMLLALPLTVLTIVIIGSHFLSDLEVLVAVIIGFVVALLVRK